MLARVWATFRYRWMIAIIALGAGVFSFRAHAAFNGYSVQSVFPSVNPWDLVFLQQTQLTRAWSPVLGATLQYSHDPLYLFQGSFADRIPAIANRLEAHVGALMALGKWAELGAYFPVVLYQRPTKLESIGQETLQTFARGDFNMTLKIPLKRRAQDQTGWGAAVAFRAFFPTGEVLAFASDQAYTFHPSVLFDVRTAKGVLLAVQTGVHTKPVSQVGETVLAGPTWTLGVGTEIPMPRHPNWLGVASLYTQVPLLSSERARQIPVEALVALRGRNTLWGGSFLVGASFGIHCAPGSPLFRLFLQGTWEPMQTKRWAEPPPPKPPVPVRKTILICEEEQKLRIPGKIYFTTDKDTLEPRSFAVLDAVVAYLQGHPEIQLMQVEGHTDARATPEYNMDLSNRRAQTVVTYLVQQGVSPERLESQGFGSTRPVADNATPEGMDENRRVEFKILSRDEKVAPNSCRTETLTENPPRDPQKK